MISRYNVWLNGQPLSDLHEDLYVADIQYPPQQIDNTTAVLANRPGAVLTRRYPSPRSVTVLFNIFAYSTIERQDILHDVIQWAKKGGILETNDREGQRLRVVCDQYPSIGSAADYTENLSITFTAYSLPFWESKTPVTLSTTDQSSHTLFVPGNVDDYGAMVDVTLTAKSSASSVTVQAGEKSITLNSVSLSSGDTIRIYHDDDMFLHIVKGNTSILDKRTGADDLFVPSGENSTFRITGSVNAEFTVRGLWR